MVYTSLTSQKGFSLIRFVIILVILAAFALVVLNFLPRIGGGVFDVINQIGYRAKRVVNGLISKVTGIGAKLAPIKERLARLIEDLKDRWYRYKGAEEFTSRALEWDTDMNLLIDLAQENGYNMQEVLKLRSQYQEGNASAKRVEVEFWRQIQNQTADIITGNIERFRTRPLGCSDFTD